MSITYVLVDENLDLLFEEMLEEFNSVQKIGNPERIIIHDIGATQMQVDAVVNAHVKTEFTEEQLALQVESGASTQAANIPGWATWDETTALNWFDTNIGNNLPVANLSEANAVLSDMATLQRNLVRLVIALRNKNFPNLQE